MNETEVERPGTEDEEAAESERALDAPVTPTTGGLRIFTPQRRPAPPSSDPSSG